MLPIRGIDSDFFRLYTPAPMRFRSCPVVSRRVGWIGSSQVWRLSGTPVSLDLSYGWRSSAATASIAVKGTDLNGTGAPAANAGLIGNCQESSARRPRTSCRRTREPCLELGLHRTSKRASGRRG